MTGRATCMLGLLLIGGAGEDDWRDPAVSTAALSEPVVHVPMDHDRRRIEVEVRLDGRGPYLFQLDTSCEVPLVLDPSLALELSCGGRAGASGEHAYPGGDLLARRALEAAALSVVTPSVGRLELGGASFLDVPAVVRPLDSSTQGGVRGVLGLPLFENLLLTIDYARSELVLGRGSLPRDAADVFPLLGPGRVPHVPIQVGGRVWPARIDTGDPENLTFPAATAREVRTQRTPAALGVSAEGARRRGARLAEPLFVVGLGYQQLPVLFAEDAEEPRLGYGMLAHFTLTFDQRQRLVRFGLASPADPPARGRGLPTAGGMHAAAPPGAGEWSALSGTLAAALR